MSTNTELYRSARDHMVDVIADYDAAVANFRWPELTGNFNWATDWFDAIATDNQRTALWIVEEDGTEQQVTFAEMALRSDRVASWLRARGVGKGDRVILMLGNQVELWESMLAVAKLGAVIMPTTGALGPADLADRIERGAARFVIANAGDVPKFDEIDAEVTGICVGGEAPGWQHYADAYAVESDGPFDPQTGVDDPLLVYFTSGTTSRPKLVEHSQVSYPVGHLSTMAWIGVRPGDVHLAISSPGWAKHAWSCFFAPWIAEATIFVYNYRWFDAAALLHQMRRARVSTFCAPPTVWRMLIQSDLGERPGQLREVLGAGEPLNPEVIAAVQRAWGLTIRDGFGQTETTLQIGNTPGQPVKAGSMGRPMPGVPVVLVDPLTGEVADEGEICLDLSAAPLNLMTGYLGDPQRNAAVMANGYYHTGDVASRDADGYITYIGRTDDVFKSSDYKVSPFELESVLIEHPAVVEAAVVPQPDDTRLSVPKAYVALADGWAADDTTARAIFEHARDHLAPYLKVRRVEFYELPKTVSGKIRRVELRKREEDAHAAGTPIESEYRYEDLVDAPPPSTDAGPTDLPILEETIGANLARTAAAHPDVEALVDVATGRRWTYAELLDEIQCIARGLMARGIECGDRVGLWAPNCAEWTIVQYAAATIGAILVNINPAYRTHELGYVLNQSGTRLLISATSFKSSDYRAMVEEVRPEVPAVQEVVFLGTEDWVRLRGDAGQVSDQQLADRAASLSNTDPINIQYTSGTTGFPKGATLSHRNILNNGYFVTEQIRLRPGDRLCIPVPFYHCFGMVMGNLGCTTHAVTMVIPAPGFDPGLTLRAIESERCTGVYGVPTMFIAMQNHPDFTGRDLSTLRTGIMAGAVCPVEVMKRCVEEMHMSEVAIAYGMTETSPVSCQTLIDDDLERRTASIGRAHPHVEIKIVDPGTGAVVERGRPGEFCTRGYSVMLGYWNDDEKTGEAIDSDGWMHTGDLAVMRADGYCNIVGRIKDMVIRGGENIYPREIEEFLYTHPDIEDAQVIGVPDEKYGEEICAWVRMKPGRPALDVYALRAFAGGKLAHYKIPRYVHVVDEFPMTVTGKVRKVEMREAMLEVLRSDLPRSVE
jgi:fatty-acyl-CoA synthase